MSYYEKGKASANTKFDVKDLFELEKMLFAVEIALAKTAQYDDSKIRIRNIQELYHVLTDREWLNKICTSTT